MSDTPSTKKKFATVTLDEPLVRGEQSIDKVTLRRPSAGDFRGTTMSAAYQMDPVALSKVISRISDPVISAPEFLAMDADDAGALAGEVVDFLLTRQQKAEAGLTE
ncbi:MAG: phage tail assembly protein [Brevundimonas sp.]|uniref:phage tail assembly protein n=1 Tax=Brevundimonas sp. TaxID=1871086 RepID=UPI00391BBBC1